MRESSAVSDLPEAYDYPHEVRFEIPERDLPAYRRAADFLNLSNADVLYVQHEFGIFGGQAGNHLLATLNVARMPVVTTLHTVLQEPNAEQPLLDALRLQITCQVPGGPQAAFNQLGAQVAR